MILDLYIPVPGNDNRFVAADGSDKGMFYQNRRGEYVQCRESLNHNGYRCAKYNWRGKYNTWPIHLGIYAAFFGVPKKGDHVHHNDGNKLNCAIENLWLRISSEHYIGHGLPEKMLAARGPWKPRFRCPITGRFTGGEVPPGGDAMTSQTDLKCTRCSGPVLRVEKPDTGPPWQTSVTYLCEQCGEHHLIDE